jgi:pathogenesis-related protein 1
VSNPRRRISYVLIVLVREIARPAKRERGRPVETGGRVDKARLRGLVLYLQPADGRSCRDDGQRIGLHHRQSGRGAGDAARGIAHGVFEKGAVVGEGYLDVALERETGIVAMKSLSWTLVAALFVGTGCWDGGIGADAGSPPPDGGAILDGGQGPGEDAGSNPDADAGSNPSDDAGSRPRRDAGSIPRTDAGSNPGTDAGGSPGADAGSEDPAIAAWLDEHEAVRAAAQPAPSPALTPLTWSGSAASVASGWAQQCNFSHNGNRGLYGENIAASTEPLTPASVVAMWSDEAKDYNYATNQCADVCGHYTQIVWRTTTSVGCAISHCTSGSPFGGGSWYFAVCDYSPPGNYIGQKPY